MPLSGLLLHTFAETRFLPFHSESVHIGLQRINVRKMPNGSHNEPVLVPNYLAVILLTSLVGVVSVLDLLSFSLADRSVHPNTLFSDCSLRCVHKL